MFLTLYQAIIKYNKVGDGYVDVAMSDGSISKSNFENLMAFWPGLQSLNGDITMARNTINPEILFNSTPFSHAHSLVETGWLCDITRRRNVQNLH